MSARRIALGFAAALVTVGPAVAQGSLGSPVGRWRYIDIRASVSADSCEP
jgi:hypothetical protein